MSAQVQNITRARQLVAELIDLTDVAIKKCKGARGWGVFDILGGETMTTFIKHMKISSTENVMREINSRLAELKRCISIQNLPEGYTVNRGVLATFADFAWDGFLSDMWMQSKIKSSLRELQTLRENLVTLQQDLNRHA